MYTDKLDDIVKEYNNKYHTSIKMKPVDVKNSACIDFKKEINNKDQNLEAQKYFSIRIYAKLV